MRPRGSPQELERRRVRAVTLVQEGRKQTEVARLLGVTDRTVRLWIASYRKYGMAGIRAKPAPGRPPKLTETHKRELERILLKGARAEGSPTDLWTCRRIAKVLQNHFGANYHVDSIGRILESARLERAKAPAPRRRTG